ncbi:hypothetical protein ZIOFF_000085 [Zingiber officinale]|uniref:PITH domain-containing protein n=2 Tax=Magnoliopsida TaxID=3398 RepID=A0A8J5LU76_ZINOF|nr:hypothetical protein ZIOFF_000085 [Zingiber officinale]
MSSSAIPRGQVDLVDFVDWSGVECLNQTGNHPIANTLKQGYRDDDGLHLESDADEQLLIYIPFTQVVKLHSAVITGPEEEGPRTVKLFANKEHMGFSNVNDYPPSDSLSLSPDNLMVNYIAFTACMFNSYASYMLKFQGKPVTLKYVKFQNVRSLTIFIEDNHGGGDITKVQKILLYGTTIAALHMVQFCGCNKCSKLIRKWRRDIALACESTIEPCIYSSPSSRRYVMPCNMTIPVSYLPPHDLSCNVLDSSTGFHLLLSSNPNSPLSASSLIAFQPPADKF